MRRRDFLKAAFTAAALTASSPSTLLAAARRSLDNMLTYGG